MEPNDRIQKRKRKSKGSSNTARFGVFILLVEKSKGKGIYFMGGMMMEDGYFPSYVTFDVPLSIQ